MSSCAICDFWSVEAILVISVLALPVACINGRQCKSIICNYLAVDAFLLVKAFLIFLHFLLPLLRAGYFWF